MGAEAIMGWDVALLDMRMPSMGGMYALRLIRTEFRHANIVLLSAYDEEETIYQAVQGGARSYLLKDASPEEIRRAVEEAAQGERHLSSHSAAQLLHRMQSQPLTPREMNVSQAMVQGKSNQEISRTLFIAEGTVKVHIVNLLSKMNANDRTQAVTIAIKRGLVFLNALG